jgi:hypothetical protein
MTRTDAQDIASRDMLTALKQALRFIEVKAAYVGAMTAAQVEEQILENANVSRVEILANSVTSLARFDIKKARAAIAQAEAAGIKAEG